MTNNYDLIVIGSGSGGSIAAAKGHQAGWTVAVIDDRPFGGTCALRGCDPKKVLQGAAELQDWQQRMKGRGMEGETSIQWQELMDFKRTFTEHVPERKEQSFHNNGIDTYHGKVSFIADNQLMVDNEVLQGERILIASGAQPVPLYVEGEEHLTTSDQLLEWDDLPERIVFIGGGYISFEFAHIAARAGAEVHIVHRGPRPLKQFDPDLVEQLLQASEAIGIQVHHEYEVNKIEKTDEKLNVHAESGDQTITLPADAVVHGGGRVPALDVDLQKGNIQAGPNGVEVNDYLQSVTNPRVYAAGDAAATKGLPLTPVASMESHIAASNILKGNNKKAEYPPMASLVFTVPKLASVGMTEEEARQSGRNIAIKHQDIHDWFTYRRTNESYAAFKLLIDQDQDQIVGAHFLSEEADELVNHFTTAIQFGIPPKQFKQVVFAYPTAASDIAHML